MIAIVVACLLAAVVITFSTRSKSDGIDSIKSGQMIWVKCNKTDCEAEYQMDKKEYFRYMEEHGEPLSTPPLVCKQCGGKSVYRAVKCPICEIIFFYGEVRNDYSSS